mmetsp:Transcript_59365/g.176280  ORF Transcript_59365/g.176280 Transcript_59365/m.176280 type:complete len:156 (-) Transcript_59365:85-552(-)
MSSYRDDFLAAAVFAATACLHIMRQKRLKASCDYRRAEPKYRYEGGECTKVETAKNSIENMGKGKKNRFLWEPVDPAVDETYPNFLPHKMESSETLHFATMGDEMRVGGVEKASEREGRKWEKKSKEKQQKDLNFIASMSFASIGRTRLPCCPYC